MHTITSYYLFNHKKTNIFKYYFNRYRRVVKHYHSLGKELKKNLNYFSTIYLTNLQTNLL